MLGLATTENPVGAWQRTHCCNEMCVQCDAVSDCVTRSLPVFAGMDGLAWFSFLLRISKLCVDAFVLSGT